MSDNLTLKLVLKANDGMSGVVRQAVRASDADFEKLQCSLKDTAAGFEDFGKKAGIIGGALTAFSGLNAKLAGDFEEGMNNVSTLIDTGVNEVSRLDSKTTPLVVKNVESLADMSNEILKIGKNSPKAIGDLTEGLYSIRSAGIDASEQFNVLRGSERLAVAGLATTAEAVDIATSAINAFQLKGKESAKMYDMFFKVVKYGKTNISEFAQGFGSVAGVVASADIKLDEYSASVAAMTTTGVKANIAHTQMKAVIAGLSRASDEQVEIFNKLGAKSFKELIAKSGGLVNALDKIKTAVGGDEAKIISLVGSVEAYNAVMSLTGATNKVYLQTLNDMRNGADSLSEAYQKQAAGFNNQMKTIGNQFQALGIKLGNGLLPVLKAGGNTLSGIIGFLDRMPVGLTNVLSIAIAGSGATLLGLSGMSFAISGAIKGFSDMLWVIREADILMWGFSGKMKAGLLGMQAGILKTIPGIQKMSGVMKAFNLICASNPIGLVIALIGVAAFVVIKYWKPITAFFRGFFAGLKEGLAPLASMFHKTGAAVKPVVNWVKKLIKPVDDAGGAAESFGKKMGNGLANAIKLAGKLAKILFNLTPIGMGVNIAKAVRGNKKDTSVDGSHAQGLDRVPFDGYRAELHKNEAVLTASEANDWRNYKGVNSGGSSAQPIVLNYNPTIEGGAGLDEAKIMSILKSHAQELKLILENVYRREGARSYA